MLLIHGFTDTWTTWKPVLAGLEARHEVFAPTLPGHHGAETVARGTRVQDTLFADALERHLDDLGIERAHIAGNSLGGWLALVLAARGRALSVCGICPAGGWYPGTPEDRALTRYFRSTSLLMRTGDWWIDLVASRPRLRRLGLREVVARPDRFSASDARQMFEGASGCQVLHEVIAEEDEMVMFGDLGPIDCPVRILYGTKDRLIRWPDYYPRLHALLPGAEFVALEGLGHIPMWDDPDAVVERVLEVTAPAGAVTPV
jgi:pimeloyl-ACP methyl ester carboxylesterase